LTINNALTLAGMSDFEISAAASLAHDSVVGISTLTYGGTLKITNTAGTLALGQSWNLFGFAPSGGWDGTSMFGNNVEFGTRGGVGTSLPALGTDLKWGFDYGLGQLKVESGVLIFNGTGIWQGATTGDWNDPAKWADSQGVHQAPGIGVAPPTGHTAVFPATVTAPTTVSLAGAEPNLQAMTFAGNSAYTLTGAGHVTLQTKTAAPTITVSAPTANAPRHQIDVPVTLDNDTTVNTVGADALLEVSGAITGDHKLTKEGAGTLVLSSPANSYGDTEVTAGTLEIAAGGILPEG
jgi:autotransporter-associated beta strand protein